MKPPKIKTSGNTCTNRNKNMPFSHNLLAKLQVDSPVPFRFPRFSSVQWVLAFSCRLPLSSQVIPMLWADGKTTDVSVKKPSACEDKFPFRSDTLLCNIETLQVRFDIFQAGIQSVKSCEIRISSRNIAAGLTNGRKLMSMTASEADIFASDKRSIYRLIGYPFCAHVLSV